MNSAIHEDVAADVIQVSAGPLTLSARLSVPQAPRGIVMFVHGSGSALHSPRDQWLACGLRARGIATLLSDLLMPDEHAYDLQTAEKHTDVPLLADRVVQVTRWIREHDQTRELRLGYFATGTGAAAAIMASAGCPDLPAAIVTRGGRVDLLEETTLSHLRTPTLLIVGGRDPGLTDPTRRAMSHLRCPHRIHIIEGAGHLFEEAGALAEVDRAAGDWFERYLPAPGKLRY